MFLSCFIYRIEDASDDFFVWSKRNRPELNNAIYIGIHIRRMGYDYHLRMTQNGTRVGLDWYVRAMTLMKQQLTKRKTLRHAKVGKDRTKLLSL